MLHYTYNKLGNWNLRNKMSRFIYTCKIDEKITSKVNLPNSLEFALNHADIPVQVWNNTVFMDEATFSTNTDWRVSVFLL